MTDRSVERYVAVPSDYYAHNYYAQRDAVWQWHYYWQHQGAMQEAARWRRNTMIAAGAGAILPQSGRTPKRNQRKAMGRVSRVISALCGLCTAAFPAAPAAHTEAMTLRDTYADARIPR